MLLLILILASLGNAPPSERDGVSQPKLTKQLTA